MALPVLLRWVGGLDLYFGYRGHLRGRWWWGREPVAQDLRYFCCHLEPRLLYRCREPGSMYVSDGKSAHCGEGWCAAILFEEMASPEYYRRLYPHRLRGEHNMLADVRHARCTCCSSCHLRPGPSLWRRAHRPSAAKWARTRAGTPALRRGSHFRQTALWPLAPSDPSLRARIHLPAGGADARRTPAPAANPRCLIAAVGSGGAFRGAGLGKLLTARGPWDVSKGGRITWKPARNSLQSPRR